ncbi:MAG: hypothetical protein AAGB31_11785 [Bdellovibrio sp.]
MKIVATWLTGVKGVVKDETRDISEKVSTVTEDQKKTNLNLANLSESVIKIDKRVTSLEAKMDAKIDMIRTDIMQALKENTNVIREFQKTQIEQISPNLSLIKGKKEEK